MFVCKNCGQHYAEEPTKCGCCGAHGDANWIVHVRKENTIVIDQVKKPCANCGPTDWKPTKVGAPKTEEEIEAEVIKMRSDAEHMIEEGAADAGVGLQQEANDLEKTEVHSTVE